MPTEAERRTAEHRQLQQDKATIESAARCMRYQAVQDHYAGLKRKELALGFALVLDTMALRLRWLDPAVRQETVRMCREFIEDVDREGQRRQEGKAGRPA